MRFRSYNYESKIATGLFANLFNDIEIARYNQDKTQHGAVIKVPIVIATRSRALKELENVNKTLKVPLIAINKENYKRDSQRMTEVYDHLRNVPDGYTQHEKMRGIPMNITFTISAITRYDSDLDQIMQNFIPFFKPDVFVSWKHPRYSNIELKSQVVWDGNINYQSPIDVNTSSSEIFQFETSFVFKTYFFAGIDEEYDDGPTILKINTSDNEFFNIGDEGYDMHRVFVVPKTMRLQEFKELANQGKIGAEASDLVCYPRIAQSPFPRYLNCYPLTTPYTAATLKVTLLDEDRSDPTFSAVNFGFTDVSQINDMMGWHFKTNIDLTSDAIDYKYVANSVWEDEFINIELQSVFDANFDWLIPVEKGPAVSTPTKIPKMSDEWVITGTTGDDIGELFTDSDVEWRNFGPYAITWLPKSGDPLRVSRYAITIGSEPLQAPRSWTLEGRTKSGIWTRLDRKSVFAWNPNEIKIFDIDKQEIDFEALRITFDRAVDESRQIAIKRFRCWPRIINSEGENAEKTVRESSFKLSLKIPGDEENSAITLWRSRSCGEDYTPEQESMFFGESVECLNEDLVELNAPSLNILQPIFFRPYHYLIVRYQGRTYGISVGGFIESPYAQSITYGDFFPTRIANGSMHVLTNTTNAPLYQYDESTGTWFEIGNPTTSGMQRTIITLMNGQGSEYKLIKGGMAAFSFNVYQASVDVQYFNVNIKSVTQGRAIFKLSSNADYFHSRAYDMIVGEDGVDIQIPFTMEGSVSSLSISLLAVGTSVPNVTLSGWSVSTNPLTEGGVL